MTTRSGSSRLLVLAGVLGLAALACTTASLGLEQPAPIAEATPAPADEEEPTLEPPTAAPPPEIGSVSALALDEALVNVYERVIPAVVNIDVSQRNGENDLIDFGSGSGFVLDTEGHIVTNNHVVADADEARVTFSDGVVLEAEVLGVDPYSDLAVLKVTPPADYTLVPVELGNSDELQVGQLVIVIGNPFGLTGSMSVGVVSAMGRTLPALDGVFSNPQIIQTDAAINPGNSGGPLLDVNGRVMGVNAAIRSETGINSGIGFAVPVNTVKRIVPQLIENGRAEYPYLGISAQSNPSLSELSVEFEMPVRQGVLVAEVLDGGPADRAGLRGGTRTVNFRGAQVALGGDIIIAIDGEPLANFDELLGYLVSNTSPGQEVVLTILRDGEEMEVPLILGTRPTTP